MVVGGGGACLGFALDSRRTVAPAVQDPMVPRWWCFRLPSIALPWAPLRLRLLLLVGLRFGMGCNPYLRPTPTEDATTMS